MNAREYNPDVATSPWETVLESVSMYKEDDRRITGDVADALARLFPGVGAEFWRVLESNYRETKERLAQ